MWEYRQALWNDPSYDFFGVAESRLGPEVDDSLINIHGYSAIRQDCISVPRFVRRLIDKISH